MTVSVKDRKILWAKSGNQCAFPGCRQELVTPDEGGTNAVVGEQAHIVSRSRRGPRGHEARPEGGFDSYGNIILLCPTHHKIVDNSPEQHTRNRLIDMKRNHESAMRLDSHEHAVPVELAQPAHDSGFRQIESWRLGQFIASVWSYGSSPILLANGRRCGSGLRFGQRHIDDASDVHWMFDSSEAEPDIEYWMSEDTITVMQHAYLYDHGEFMPFIRREFRLTLMPPAERRVLLIRPDLAKLSQIPLLVGEIESLGPGSSSREIEDFLSQLWQAGLGDPDRVITILKNFRGHWWYDGYMAETATAMARELALVPTATEVDF